MGTATEVVADASTDLVVEFPVDGSRPTGRSRSPRLCLVAPDPGRRDAVVDALRALHPRWRHVANVSALTTGLEQFTPEVLLICPSGVHEVAATMTALVRHGEARELPVVVVGGWDPGEPAWHVALQSGVRHVLPAQTDAAMLTTVVTAVLRERRHLLRLRRDARRHRLLAERDALTGLGRPVVLHRRLASAEPERERVGMLVIDVDQFKGVNDGYGHIVGDRVLKELATRLRLSLRRVDDAVRWGGDEFIALLAASDLSDCEVAAQRLLDAVRARPLATDVGGTVPVTTTISVGVAWGGLDLSLLEAADDAVRAAKAAGGDQMVVSR